MRYLGGQIHVCGSSENITSDRQYRNDQSTKQHNFESISSVHILPGSDQQAQVPVPEHLALHQGVELVRVEDTRLIEAIHASNAKCENWHIS